MGPGTSVKKASLMPILRSAEGGRVRLSHVARAPGPAVTRAQALARRERAQSGVRDPLCREQRRVRPHRLRLDAEPVGRRVHDRGPKKFVVFDREVQIGPAHERRATRIDVDVIETAVAEPWSGPQVLARGHTAHLAGRDEIRVEDEDLASVESDLDVAAGRSCEPRMPPDSSRTGPRVATHVERQVESCGTETQRWT